MSKKIFIPLVLLLGVFLAACSEEGEGTPRDVVKDYITAQTQQNWGKTCNFFDKETQESIASTLALQNNDKEEKTCAEALLDLPKDQQISFAAVTSSLWVGRALEQDKRAKVFVTRKIKDQEAEGFILLKKESGKWRVDYNKSELPVIKPSQLK